MKQEQERTSNRQFTRRQMLGLLRDSITASVLASCTTPSQLNKPRNSTDSGLPKHGTDTPTPGASPVATQELPRRVEVPSALHLHTELTRFPHSYSEQAFVSPEDLTHRTSGGTPIAVAETRDGVTGFIEHRGYAVEKPNQEQQILCVRTFKDSTRTEIAKRGFNIVGYLTQPKAWLNLGTQTLHHREGDLPIQFFEPIFELRMPVQERSIIRPETLEDRLRTQNFPKLLTELFPVSQMIDQFWEALFADEPAPARGFALGGPGVQVFEAVNERMYRQSSTNPATLKELLSMSGRSIKIRGGEVQLPSGNVEIFSKDSYTPRAFSVPRPVQSESRKTVQFYVENGTNFPIRIETVDNPIGYYNLPAGPLADRVLVLPVPLTVQPGS